MCYALAHKSCCVFLFLRSTEVFSMDRDKLFEQFAPLVNRLIRQYGTTPAMRQDLLGELYSLFHIFLDRYDPDRGVPLHAYLVRQLSVSASSLARTQRGREQHEASLSATGEGDFGLPLTHPTPHWDDALNRDEITAQLPTLIQSLTLRQKQVFVLRYYESRSFEEIAQMMGIQTSSVRSLLRSALKRLRESMLAIKP